jgi:uncharacterized integral membrane protein
MLVVVILIVENHEAMNTSVKFRVNFLGFEQESTEMTLYHIVTIAFLFGVLVIGFYGMLERFRLKKQIKTLTAATREKDEELNSLRNLPITSESTSEDLSLNETDST